MADISPDAAPPANNVNPVITVLIRIVGIIILVLAVVLLLYIVALAVAFGGSESLLSGLIRTPEVWILLLIAAGGAGLILYARKRNRLHRQGRNDRFRRA